MPFEIRWIMSRRRNKQAAYQSTQNPGTGYVFNFKKTFNGWDLYGCSFCACAALKKKTNQEECPKIPTIKVKDDQFLVDPESILHVCADGSIDRSWNKIILGHYYNDTVRILKENGEKGGNDNIISARSAQELMEKAIREENADIVDQAPPRKKTKRVFNKAVSQFRKKAENPLNIDVTFEIRWIMSRRKKRQAAYRSAQNPGTGYVFNFKKTFNGWDLYGCSFCACVARKRNINQEECPKIPTIRVKDDQFLQDPESIYHVCADETIDRSWNKIILGHYYNDTIRELKENGEKDNIISARSAQELMEKAIREEDADILDQAPSMKKTKRVFNKAVSQFRKKAENPQNIDSTLSSIIETLINDEEPTILTMHGPMTVNEVRLIVVHRLSQIIPQHYILNVLTIAIRGTRAPFTLYTPTMLSLDPTRMNRNVLDAITGAQQQSHFSPATEHDGNQTSYLLDINYEYRFGTDYHVDNACAKYITTSSSY